MGAPVYYWFVVLSDNTINKKCVSSALRGVRYGDLVGGCSLSLEEFLNGSINQTLIGGSK